MQKKKSKILKKYISFLLAFSLLGSPLQLPQAVKEVKAENQNSGKKILPQSSTPAEQPLNPGIYKQNGDGVYDTASYTTWNEAISGDKPIIQLDKAGTTIEKFDWDAFGFHACKVVLPSQDSTESENGYQAITTIEKKAFVMTYNDGTIGKNSYLKEIEIGSSVTTIGANAFTKCEGLEKVEIKDGAENANRTIGEEAFKDCIRLKQLTIGDGITSIGARAFENCLALGNVTMPASITSIGESVFEIGDDAYIYAEKGLTSIEFKGKLKAIPKRAFYGCDRLTSIKIPNSVTSIGESAFESCYNASSRSGLTTVTIGEDSKLESIGKAAFDACHALTKITIPNSVKTIGNGAFSNCSSLNVVTIDKESELTEIEKNAFYGCGTLEEITIPNKLTTIGDTIFKNCESLNTVKISSDNLSKLDMKGTEIFKTATWIENNDKEVKFILSDDSIALDHFKTACESIQIKLGADVTYTIRADETILNKKVVSGTSIHMGEAGSIADTAVTSYQWYKETADNGNLITNATNANLTLTDDLSGIKFVRKICWGDKYTLTQSISTALATEYVKYTNADGATQGISWEDAVDKGYIEVSNNNTFEIANVTDNPLLTATKVEIAAPMQITKIGGNAFTVCAENLQEVKISGNITTIENSAFHNCSKLTNITLPETITNIGRAVFYNCSNLTEMTLPNSVTSIGSSAFSRCSKLKEIVIPSQVTIIEEEIFSSCFALTKVTIKGEVTQIQDRAFNCCFNLREITLPDTVTSIGRSTFYDCSKLEKIDIPSQVTTIEDSTFSGCRTLTQITIKGKVTNIGQGAFSGCHNLKEIEIPDTVTSIGAVAFCECENLKEITIPNKIASIDYGAFSECTALKIVKVSSEKIANIFTVNNNVAMFNNITTPIDFVLTDSNLTLNQFKTICSTVSDESFSGNNDNGKCIDWRIVADVTNTDSETIDKGTIVGNTLEMKDADSDDYKVGVTGSVSSPTSYQWYQEDGTTKIEGATSVDLNLSNQKYGKQIFVREVIWKDGKYRIKQRVTANYTENYIKYTDQNGKETAISWEDAVSKQYITIKQEAFMINFDTTDNPLTTAKKLEIIAPKEITTVGSFAFKDLAHYNVENNLEEIVLSKNITSIANSGFNKCRKLKGIDLKNITSIGSSAFADCEALTEISIPKGITSILNDTFNGCSNLNTISLPEGMISIEDRAFANCSKLTSIILPESITKIGISAFYQSGITSLNLANTNIEFVRGTFSGVNITTVTLPEGTVLKDAANVGKQLRTAFDGNYNDNMLQMPVTKEATVGATLRLGEAGELDVSLKDFNTVSYQWFKVNNSNSQEISNETNADLKLDATQFPVGTHTLIRRVTWTDTSSAKITVNQVITLKVNSASSGGGGTILPPTTATTATTATTEAHKHKAVIQNQKAATCTQTGYTGDTVCSTCGEVLQKGEEIPATGHKLKKVKAKKASVDAAGNVEHYTCENCGKLFANKTGQKELKKSQVIVSLKVKKGEILKKKDGVSYQVVDAKKLQVSYVSPSKKKSGTISIPFKVNIGGKIYQVIRIKKNAFKNNKKVRKIVIPSSVIYIENYAFANMKKLKTIEIKTTKLKKTTVSSKAFKKISKKVVMKVPKKKWKEYKKLLRKKGLSKKNKFKTL